MSRKKPPTLADDAKVAVAVSGGSDSLALLHSFFKNRYTSGPKNVCAVTVDHRLRDDSGQEAEYVAWICDHWGIEHTILKWGEWDGQGNLQDAARRARYRLMAEWGHENGVDAIVLGHTILDRAETFLMQVGRKAGIDGLTTMPEAFERDGMWFHRPFLDANRSELKEALTKEDIFWISDPSNEDESFQRVRVRSALDLLAQADITPYAIADVMNNLGKVRESLLDIFRLLAEQQVREDNGDIVISARHYMAMPPEFRRMLLQYGVHWVAGGEHGPRMRSLKKLPMISGRYVPFTVGGCIILNFVSMPIDAPRMGGGPADVEMRITREHEPVSRLETPLNELWDGRWHLEGPSDENLRIRALGEAVNQCPDWRETGIPRQSLLASPSVWHENTLISAPLAGYSNGFTAKATGRGNFIEFLLSR